MDDKKQEKIAKNIKTRIVKTFGKWGGASFCERMGKLGFSMNSNAYANINSHNIVDNLTLDKLDAMCAIFDCDIYCLLNNSEYKSIDNLKTGNKTGLSDNALNTLKSISSKDDDDIRYKYIMQAINLILDSEYNAGVLFWIGLFIFGQLDGYLYETKKGLKKQPFIDMGQLGKGIHFYGNNGDELTLEADLLNTAIFDRIRNSLENLEELQN